MKKNCTCFRFFFEEKSEKIIVIFQYLTKCYDFFFFDFQGSFLTLFGPKTIRNEFIFIKIVPHSGFFLRGKKQSEKSEKTTTLSRDLWQGAWILWYFSLLSSAVKKLRIDFCMRFLIDWIGCIEKIENNFASSETSKRRRYESVCPACWGHRGSPGLRSTHTTTLRERGISCLCESSYLAFPLSLHRSNLFQCSLFCCVWCALRPRRNTRERATP